MPALPAAANGPASLREFLLLIFFLFRFPIPRWRTVGPLACGYPVDRAARHARLAAHFALTVTVAQQSLDLNDPFLLDLTHLFFSSGRMPRGKGEGSETRLWTLAVQERKSPPPEQTPVASSWDTESRLCRYPLY
jgi:hypothetical protein